MKIPKFTDEQLEHYADNPSRDMSSLEMQLAHIIIDDRKAFRQLITEIEPMAKQVIHPSSNVFSRQLSVINERL